MSDTSYSTKEKSQFMNVQGGEKKVMKKILSVALSTAMAFSMFASVAFGDAATTPQQKFDALAAKGILNGYPDGQAHLEKDLTRAEFAKIVTKLFDLTEVTNKLSYKDKGYNASNWAVPYIEAVTAANLMQGKDTVKAIFDYNGKVTVEEVAAVLFRALKLEAPTTTDNTASAWAKGYAQAVIDAGLIAKDTNFKANASRSLVVEVAYAVDQKTAAPTVASAEAVSPTKVVVTFSDKTTTTVELTTALVAGVETTINFKHNDHDYTTKVTLAAPKVVSVEAPNAKQVVVKFNRAVDTETISSNGTLIDDVVSAIKVGTTGNVLANAEVGLSADGTVATFTLPGETSYLKGNYTVSVSADVKTSASEAFPAFTNLLTVADTTAPTLATVTSVAKTTTNKVYVTFSEPVKLYGLIATVNGSAATVTRDTYNSFILTSSSTLTSGQTYDVSLLNATDFAGNVATTNPIKSTVSVTSDAAAPTITKLTTEGDKYINVEFSKKVNRDSLVGNVRLLDADGTSKGVFTVVTSADGTSFSLRSPLGAMPTGGTFTGTVVFGAGVKDTLGNTLGTAVTQAVTFTKDTVAPTVTSATYTSKGLVIKFSEKVLLVGGKDVTLINDSTGVVVKNISSSTGVLSSDKKTLTLPVASFTGAHTVRIAAGLVTDDTFAKNALASTVLAVTGASASSDTTAPKINKIEYTDSTTTNTSVTVRVYAEDETGLNVPTLMNVSSYTLNGAALPAGSFVTIEDSNSVSPKTATAVVHIPGSAISETKSYDFVVSGIADTAGNGISPAFIKALALTDRVSPTLNTAVVASNDSNSLVLGFSEKVDAVASKDLEFKINNVVIPTTDVNIGARIESGNDINKYNVTFTVKSGVFNGEKVLYVGSEPSDANIIAYTKDAAGTLGLGKDYINSITVTVKSGATIKDMSQNTITSGTEVVGK
jgi:hypothetical protein